MPVLCRLETHLVGNSPIAKRSLRAWKRLLGCREEAWPSGKVIFRQGDQATDVFFLTGGLAILTWDVGDGSEGVLGLRFPGQVLDYCAHGFGMPYPASAETIARSTLCRIPLTMFQAKARGSIQVAQLFEHLLMTDLYNAAKFIVNLKTAKPADRFEQFLHYFAAATGQTSTAGSKGISVPLRDYQMADLMGLSTRHFERIKRELQLSGRLELKGPDRFLLRR